MNICRVCENPNADNDLFTVKEMMFGFKDEFKYFQCTKCECIQIQSFPTNISKYYPTNYYSLSEYDGKRFQGLQGFLYRYRNRASLFRDNFVLKFLHFISPVRKYEIFQGLGINRDLKILDVGCGNGDFFIFPMKELGFKNVKGCDPYIEKDIFYRNGLQICKSDVFGIEGKWDLIIYNHSFEHLPNPIENLKKVKELLSPGGTCIIRTPVVPSFAWEKYGVCWFQLDAPRHFFIHSPKSIATMCEIARLRIETVAFDSTLHQFIASEGYQNTIPLVKQKHAKNFIDKARRIRYSRLAKKLNAQKRGDQVAYVLRNIN